MKDADKSLNNAHELDRILDAHLAKYAAAEPRPGLENRILANFRAVDTRAEVPVWTKWILAGAAVAIIVIAVAIAWRPVQSSRPAIASRPPNTIQKTNLTPKPNSETRLVSENKPVRKLVRHAAIARTVAAAEPKLDQFPSPQPLTKEELAFVRYARDFPEDGQLIARAQEEYDQRVRETMMGPNTLADRSGSEQ
jgi:hypothetical protein